MKKRKARAPRRNRAPSRPKRLSVAELIRATALRLERAKLVFAHGTSDPVAEAAFLVGETLGIHPDHVDVRAGMAVTAAQQKRISALIERRIRTRKPAAYLLNRIYMRGVPFIRRARDRAALLPGEMTAKRSPAKAFRCCPPPIPSEACSISAPAQDALRFSPRCGFPTRRSTPSNFRKTPSRSPGEMSPITG